MFSLRGKEAGSLALTQPFNEKNVENEKQCKNQNTIKSMNPSK